MLLPRLTALTWLLLAGCANQLSGSTSPKTSPSAEPSGHPPSAQDCKALRELICETAGESSAECTGALSTLGLLPPQACAIGLSQSASIQAALGTRMKACPELQNRLCAELGKDTRGCKMVTDETPRMAAGRCQAMLEHYQEILDELKGMEERYRPLSSELQALIAAGDVPSLGPVNAKVVLVEFSDFQCPYCSKASTVLETLRAKYEGQIRIVFRQFPLSFHQNAQLAAEASLAAHAQGKFWEMHDALFTHQSELGRESIDGYARTLGLDMKKFARGLDDRTHGVEVERDLELGKQVTVEGTPTWFLNGKRVDNPTDLDEMLKLVDAEL
jgi:hypothetical protein